MKKIVSILFTIVLVLSLWFLYSEVYNAQAQYSDSVTFTIEPGESVSSLADRLEEDQIIRHSWLFKKYLSWKKLDRQVRQGTFEVAAPITLTRVVEALSNPSANERQITIIPGWDLRDVAQYFEHEGIASSTDLYAVVGKPAYNYRAAKEYPLQPFDDMRVLDSKSDYLGLEGYLAPDTYRIFKDATITDVVYKLLEERDRQFTEQMYNDIGEQGRSVHEVLIMASILEREVKSTEDRKKVADLFWRRYEANWALQADSTVHYAVGKKGDVATTVEDRDSLSPWNTYKYPGLPPGPISNPSLDSIMAAIYPEENDYWYFLTTLDTGEVKYAKTLEEHNANVQKYLR